MAFALSAAFACALGAGLADRCAVDGVANGPVSKWQPEAQPAAAEPTKVGLNDPRLDDLTLDDVTVVAVVFATGAAAAPPENATNATGSAKTDTSATNLRTRLFLISCM
jgi:hypothetical protein